MRAVLLPAITNFLGGLRFRNLFLITAALFAVNVVFPDIIPFVDELLLGLATLVLARWKDRDAPQGAAGGAASPHAPPPPDVIDLPRDQVRREG